MLKNISKSKLEYFRNLFFSYLSQIAAGLTLFIATPFLIKGLGLQLYGVYALIFSFNSYFNLTDIGLSTSLIRETVNGVIKNDLTGVKLALNSTIFYYIVTFICILFLSIALLDPRLGNLGRFLIKDTKLVNTFYNAFLVVILTFFLNLVIQIFDAVLQGFNKIYINKRIKAIRNLLECAGFILISIYHPNIFLLLFVSLSLAFLHLAYLYSVFHKITKIKLNIKDRDLVVFKNLLKQGIWYFIGSFSVVLIFNTNIFIISSVLGIQYVGIFFVYNRFFEVIRTGFVTLTQTLFPKIAEMKYKGENVKLLNLFFKIWIGLGGLLLVIFYPLQHWGLLIFQHWSKLQNVDSRLYFFFLIFNSFIIWDNCPSIFIGAIGEQKRQAMVSILQGIINVVLGYILIKNYGLDGAIVSSIIALLITNIWYNVYFLNNKLKYANG
ncbi:lipopolysaccharide biosynthesis protein [Pedobacter vanadiisoli]|uniref:Lipopolysaccharide biosynthesis protein n=1 Tax=Pedobacter vanadiisoli TaxID=1761975 RepID=A0ABW5MPH2_9SPHI